MNQTLTQPPAAGEAAHTPTPWRVAAQIATEGIWIESGGDEPDEICHVSTATLSGAEAKANARLIAAAPELLEALQRVAALGMYSKAVLSDGEYADIISQARAAIAAAKSV